MAKPKPNRFGSINSGRLSKGCLLCMQGKKMVVFATGKCQQHCYFCPISSAVKGKDIIKADERSVKKLSDILTEACEMRACGAGITGGEPLCEIKRVCKIIRLLKRAFGKRFHIHLYTWGSLATEKNIRLLERAGLDEIRFHLFKERGSFDRILPALGSRMQVTVEVPAIPTRAIEAELREMVDFMKAHGIKFLNLNEFEFSDSNFDAMRAQGFRQLHGFTYAVRGSKQTALRLMKYARPEINVNFCPTFIKSGLQLRERLKRRACTIRKRFERVNADGFLEKAVVEGVSAPLAKIILKKFKRSEKLFFYNKEKKRIETTEHLAGKIASEFCLPAFWLVEYPCFGAWDFEKVPLD